MASEEEEFEAYLHRVHGAAAPHLSADARRVGLDRNTEEGALLHFSASLNGSNPRHRLIAWVLLLAFGFPVVIGTITLAWRLFRSMMHW